MFGVLDYPFEGLWPFLRRAVDAFGADRVMWASDHGGDQTGKSWGELFYCMPACTALSKAELEWVLGGTVRKILQWN